MKYVDFFKNIENFLCSDNFCLSNFCERKLDKQKWKLLGRSKRNFVLSRDKGRFVIIWNIF